MLPVGTDVMLLEVKKKENFFFLLLKEEYVVLFMDLILPPDSQSSYLQDTSPMLDLILNWVHISIKRFQLESFQMIFHSKDTNKWGHH